MSIRRYLGLFGFWLIRKACGSPGGAWVREVRIHGPCPPLRPLDPKKPLVVYNLDLDGRAGDPYREPPITDMTKYKSDEEARRALGLPPRKAPAVNWADLPPQPDIKLHVDLSRLEYDGPPPAKPTFAWAWNVPRVPIAFDYDAAGPLQPDNPAPRPNPETRT